MAPLSLRQLNKRWTNDYFKTLNDMQDEMKEDLGDKGDKSQIKEKHDPEINRKKLIEADRRKIELWKGLKDHFKE